MSNGGFGTTFGFPNHKYCPTSGMWICPDKDTTIKLKDLETKLADQEKKNENLQIHIEELNKIIDNKNIDLGLKNQTIQMLKKKFTNLNLKRIQLV